MMFDKKIKEKVNRVHYIFSLFLIVAVVIIFNNSFYWGADNLLNRRVVVYICSFLIVLVCPFILAKSKLIFSLILKIKKIVDYIAKHPLRIAGIIGSYLIGVVLAYVLAAFLGNYHYHEAFNIYRFYFCIVLIWILITAYFWSKLMVSKPEMLFLCVILMIGTFFIAVSPARTGVSWDDEIHYENTLNLSNLMNGIMYKADMKNIDEYLINRDNYIGYDRTSKEQYNIEMEKAYDEKKLVDYEFNHFSASSIAYIPSAIGIIIARGLELSYIHVFMMGKFFNLLMYSLLVFFAIKKVRYGKVLIAAIGLIPTNIFMAASYSYDTWVIGFVLLGFACFFSLMQEDFKKITMKDSLKCIFLILVGCIPKAAYFPLLFPFLFIPSKKFVNKKEKRKSIIAVLISGVVLVAICLLPLFIEEVPYTDTRGGTEVNGTEQILFILQNPLTFVRVLYGFYKSYLAIDSIGYGFQHYAYMGYGMLWGIAVIVIIITAVLDRDVKKTIPVSLKLSGIIACGATVILMTTALYISFTAVGSGTVSGMHDRYFFPLLYPLIYFAGVDGVKVSIDKRLCVCLPILILSLTFLYNINMFCVTPY